MNLRQSLRGASASYGLVPDLLTKGKIIGRGLPIAAIGGWEGLMRVFDASAGGPLLPQGGTFSANPLSITAALTAMNHLDHAAFASLEELVMLFGTGLLELSQKRGRHSRSLEWPLYFEFIRWPKARITITKPILAQRI